MRMSYEERQSEWVKKHDIKVGDHVLLIRDASDGEDAWPNVWPCAADGWIGNILKVREISEVGIACYNPEAGDWFGFPYFVLEKVVEHKDKEWTVSYGLKVKTGDPVLMRSENDSQWTYSLFSYIHTNKKVPYPYYGCGNIGSVCIPYKGNEHLTGTTDAYVSEKQESPKFAFGAKVKAKLNNGEEKEGVLIGFDTKDQYAPFGVAVQDEDASFNCSTYWVKNVTYID